MLALVTAAYKLCLLHQPHMDTPTGRGMRGRATGTMRARTAETAQGRAKHVQHTAELPELQQPHMFFQFFFLVRFDLEHAPRELWGCSIGIGTIGSYIDVVLLLLACRQAIVAVVVAGSLRCIEAQF